MRRSAAPGRSKILSHRWKKNGGSYPAGSRTGSKRAAASRFPGPAQDCQTRFGSGRDGDAGGDASGRSSCAEPVTTRRSSRPGRSRDSLHLRPESPLPRDACAAKYGRSEIADREPHTKDVGRDIVDVQVSETVFTDHLQEAPVEPKDGVRILYGGRAAPVTCLIHDTIRINVHGALSHLALKYPDRIMCDRPKFPVRCNRIPIPLLTPAKYSVGVNVLQADLHQHDIIWLVSLARSDSRCEVVKRVHLAARITRWGQGLVGHS